MTEWGGIVRHGVGDGRQRVARIDRRRLLGIIPTTVVGLLALSACGSSDDDDDAVEDVATRVTVAGAPDPLPTPDPNATPAEDATGGSAAGAVGGDAGAAADGDGGGGGDAAAGGAVVELSAPGIAWSTNELAVPVGGTIRLMNDGSGGEHNFAVEGYNDDSPVDMPIGETVDWPIPGDLAAGTYTYYCAIPGHRALMEGTLTIQ